MAKKAETTAVEDEQPTETGAVVAEELYDAVLTRTVKRDGEFYWPGTTFVGIGVDFASELQTAVAAEITIHEVTDFGVEPAEPENA
ncbi:hypothetical protein GHL01_00410 [Sinorhizobium meliloti]|uniref:hypothetical protein n=1 Tax=Rhizobium meliloti TaxID=382 RepID=UPI00129679B9|nr:hypothetical protein [Sinorhizobium meliloti]MQV12207.1 hypothetical protein [Sinorhizobium meliloti]